MKLRWTPLLSVVLLTTFSLFAFAGNSLLCRLALGDQWIDPLSFTVLRLLAGALALVLLGPCLLIWHRSKDAVQPAFVGPRASWVSGLALFVYAFAFSLAYLWLSAGTGALILFGSVNVTIIGDALQTGERLRPRQWAGTFFAGAGLVYLMLPGISAPDPFGAVLMCLSGVAWGVYTIRGRGLSAPGSTTGTVLATALVMTRGNFTRASAFAAVAMVAAFATLLVANVPDTDLQMQSWGFLLAVITGMLPSGLGYVLWYGALHDLRKTKAAVVQLTVPVLAALGGAVFLSESITRELVVAAVVILGGVHLAVQEPRPGRQRPEDPLR